MRLSSPSAPRRRHHAAAAVAAAWPSPLALPGRSGAPLALPVTSRRMRRAAGKAGHRLLAATAAADGADADAPAVISKITTVRRMTKVCTHQRERCHSVRNADETGRLPISRRAVHKPAQLLAIRSAPAQQP